MCAATRQSPCALRSSAAKKKILLTIALKRIKYLWVNLTQKKCQAGNYKILLKEIKDPNKWKYFHVHELEDSIVKMTIVYKLESLLIKFWIEINYVKFEQFPQILPLIVTAWAWKL